MKYIIHFSKSPTIFNWAPQCSKNGRKVILKICVQVVARLPQRPKSTFLGNFSSLHRPLRSPRTVGQEIKKSPGQKNS